MTLHVSDFQASGPSRLARAKRSFARWFRGARSRGLSSLRTTVAILKAQQEATLDGILVVDSEGHVLSYNRRFLEIWGIPDEVASGANDEQLLAYAADKVTHWDSFIELVKYLYKHPHEVRSGDPIVLKDGRILMRASIPVLADGSYAGRAWYFRDVTETQRGEAMQNALFRIAQMARETTDLTDFYREIHEVVGQVMFRVPASTRDPFLAGLLPLLRVANIYWAFFNLMPVMPMDGFGVVRNLLRIFLQERAAFTIAIWISIIVGSALAIVGLVFRQYFLALLVLWYVRASYMQWQFFRSIDRTHD